MQEYSIYTDDPRQRAKDRIEYLFDIFYAAAIRSSWDIEKGARVRISTQNHLYGETGTVTAHGVWQGVHKARVQLHDGSGAVFVPVADCIRTNRQISFWDVCERAFVHITTEPWFQGFPAGWKPTDLKTRIYEASDGES